MLRVGIAMSTPYAFCSNEVIPSALYIVSAKTIVDGTKIGCDGIVKSMAVRSQVM